MKSSLQTESRQLMRYLGEAIGAIRDPAELFRTVAKRMRLVFDFDAAVIVTLDRDLLHMNVFVEMLRFSLPEAMNRRKLPLAGSWLQRYLDERSVVLLEIGELLGDESGAHPEVLRFLHNQGMRHLVLAPLRSGGHLDGFLMLFLEDADLWSRVKTELLTDLMMPISISVSNANAYEELRQREAETAMQLAINNAILGIRDRRRMMLAVCDQISRLVPCDFMGMRVAGRDGMQQSLDSFMRDPRGRFVEFSPAEYFGFEPEREEFIAESFELISRPGLYSGEAFEKLCREFRLIELIRQRVQIGSVISFMLWDNESSRAGLFFARRQHPFQPEDLSTLRLIVPQLSLALQNFFAFDQIDRLRRKLEGERTYLIRENRSVHDFGEIIGNSPALSEVLRRVSQVAPTDASVLVQGETGTGKELIARAIHNRSPRKNNVLVRVNCAALPASLIESELFGHEKGSFTGAIDRRIGKFELADGGTIFLDEIGELPLELQAKLLRVLQEKELERLGGRQVIKINVRVIAATNRDLEAEVAAHRFRGDLFFRLNVFPLQVPPLRERREDIRPLAIHFARKFAREFGRPVREIREADIVELTSRSWKGNIRELSHCIEQAVIMSDGERLDFSSVQTGLAPQSGVQPDRAIPMTLPELSEHMKTQELQLILQALDRCGGRVSGTGGAARMLDINPKTLYSRLDALGIGKRYMTR